MRPIVTPDEASEWLARSDLHGGTVVVEVGTTMAGGDPAAAFAERRVSGARLLSLDDELAGEPGPVVGRHPLPDPAAFAMALGRAGIGDDTTVIAYDRVLGGHAARLVWMLRVLGNDAALLDGGLDGWTGAVDAGLSTGPITPVDRTPIGWPDHAIADADDVARLIDDGGTVVDSRDAARYRGEYEPLDPVAGHIPGAINLPFTDNLVADDGRPTATWRPLDELDRRFLSVSAAADAGQLIVSCGSGVTACHNALAIEAVGYRRPRLYVGSWSGWSSDPHRPVAVGDGT